MRQAERQSAEDAVQENAWTRGCRRLLSTLCACWAWGASDDKATVEISSRYDGEVIKIYTEVGGIANVGKPLIDLLKPADAATPGVAPAVEKAPSAPGPPVTHLARTQLGGLQ
jgi:hypothetical protein